MHKLLTPFFYFLMVLLLLCFSCVPERKPYFNQSFLRDAQPGNPSSKIELNREISDELIKGTKIVHWISDDNLLLYINQQGGSDSVYVRKTYLIIPSTGQILKLEGAEEEVVLKEFDERIDVHNIMSTGEDISKTALKSGFTGERLMAKYEGSVKDNGNVIDVNVDVIETTSQQDRGLLVGILNLALWTCNGARLDMSIENKSTGKKSLTYTYRFPWVCSSKITGFNHDREIISTLKKMRISPGGTYYLFAYRRAQKDYYMGHVKLLSSKDIFPIIESYNDAWDMTINPEWTKVAILRGTKSKDNNYDFWIEFFPFLNPEQPIQSVLEGTLSSGELSSEQVAWKLNTANFKKKEIAEYWETIKGKMVTWKGEIEFIRGGLGYYEIFINSNAGSKQNLDITFVCDETVSGQKLQKEKIDSRRKEGGELYFRGTISEYRRGKANTSAIITLDNVEILSGRKP